MLLNFLNHLKYKNKHSKDFYACISDDNAFCAGVSLHFLKFATTFNNSKHKTHLTKMHVTK